MTWVIALKGLRIRNASTKDLDAICHIEADAFPPPESFPPSLFDSLLQEPANSFLLGEDASGEHVGYCVSSLKGSNAHLISIAVLREHRRRGVASALLQNLMERLEHRGVDELWLEVNTGNEGAITLYEKFGFAKMMILENYYSDGSPALRMRLSLNKQLLRAERNKR